MTTHREGRIFYTDDDQFAYILQFLGFQWNGSQPSVDLDGRPVNMHRFLYNPRMDELATAFAENRLNVPNIK